MRLRPFVRAVGVVGLAALVACSPGGGGSDAAPAADAGNTGGCQANADCSAMGEYFVCRKSQCVNLVTSLCTTVYATKTPASAAYMDESAVFFGSILPTAANADGPFGKLLEDSIKLALDDFAAASGIPGLSGGATRPLVLVGCNDGVNEDQTDVAARHLVNDVGVPAIIGYAFSGNTISVAQDVTIPGDVLLFSPSATSAQITSLQATDKGLVWRTAPSDDVQAIALTAYYPSVLSAVQARYPKVNPSQIKVGVAHHSDDYGQGLYVALNNLLGKTVTLTEYDYQMSTSPDLGQIANLVNDAPDILFVFGFNEGPDTIFRQVESQWMTQADGHRPFWVFSDGGKVSSLWASSTNPMMAADISTNDQRQRVRGAAPGVSAQSWPPYGTFLTEFSASGYSSDGSADTIGPAGAYDILYLLAYSTVMVDKNPLTGPNLVKYGLSQMQKTAGLPQIQIGRSNILTTFPQLTTSMPINVTGVSGPLPFDGKGDIQTADIQIWCVPPASPPDTDVSGAAIDSGLYFDSATGAMAGSISATCALQ